jgi:hypothetical protein
MMRSLARSSASSLCKAALNSSILWRSILPSMAVSQALPDDGVNILTGIQPISCDREQKQMIVAYQSGVE